MLKKPIFDDEGSFVEAAKVLDPDGNHRSARLSAPIIEKTIEDADFASLEEMAGKLSDLELKLK